LETRNLEGNADRMNRVAACELREEHKYDLTDTQRIKALGVFSGLRSPSKSPAPLIVDLPEP
jgi:hypothetical protein